MKHEADWPFQAWLKIEVFQLGLSPENFWEMTLKDWLALTETPASNALNKSDLIKLEREYEQS